MPTRSAAAARPSVAATPLAIFNRPGLSEIAYRVGTFATFREAMLELIAQQAALAGLTTREAPSTAPSPTRSSALQLIFNLPTVDGEAYEVLGASDERYVIEGGSQRVTDALVEAHGARIETGHRLVALAPADGGRVTLRFASGNETTVDRVILALPASLLGEIDHGGLLTADWQAFAREVRLGANEKLNAVYRRKPWTATPMGIDGATWDLSDGARVLRGLGMHRRPAGAAGAC